ncbi:MAG: AMP-binding protein [Candidatus Geothermincolales bacterium]
MRVFDYLDRWAEERPGAEALVFGETRVTFSQYLKEAERFAAGLLALGVEKGDRVGLYIPNHLEFVFGYLDHHGGGSGRPRFLALLVPGGGLRPGALRCEGRGHGDRFHGQRLRTADGGGPPGPARPPASGGDRR